MSEPSDKMLELLQQISVLKELDQQYRAGDRSDAEKQDSNKRRKNDGRYAMDEAPCRLRSAKSSQRGLKC